MKKLLVTVILCFMAAAVAVTLALVAVTIKVWFDAPGEQPATFAKDANRNGQAAYERRDFAAAIRWFKRAADQGFPNAQHNMGLLYERGDGVSRDSREALRWYRKAAAHGFVPSQLAVGTLYESGRAGMPVDHVEAMRWFLRAAARGDPTAQAVVGWHYVIGVGVPKDYAEAMRWSVRAANQGSAVAQSNVGLMYDNGWGVPMDPGEAVRWYLKSANNKEENNDASAMARFSIGLHADILAEVRAH
jgi:TPR repeat protein